ncbi:uncharacterized protein GGS22DRAFT_179550 [Annulohypoxylon maeteangense]|uniref:uncharacterized protein n=1 Tax=Annulohypoxylon maeteangense TaxID=1927788 RepID=UPI002008EB5B|nr:uncharacterized protein GGS22DRAFT_179550 [Annulohypoxylon maeteangense]KAI0885868.1 hypothetical protein GGS22DRAFT_179550 [Annulohypoxylon maeteangense]
MATNGNHSLEGRFLQLKEMRGLLHQDRKRVSKIVNRCNWYMFNNPGIRGQIGSIKEFYKLCQTAISDYPPEQEMPNEELANNPPSKGSFYDKYFLPYPEGSPYWFSKQDLIPSKDIHDVLAEAWNRWQTISTRATQVYEAIESIPKPNRIKKVVCLGLGAILRARSPENNIRNSLCPRSVAQHCLAIAIVKRLERNTGKQISLYTSDLAYTAQHKIALERSNIIRFNVLDPSYGKHEQFPMIDDNTMLIDFTGPPDCPTMAIIEEYARPVVIIGHAVPQTGPYQDRQWFEVTEEDGNKLRVPGCANLPLPDGMNIGVLCPKRVRDMMVHEYNIESKFPAEDPDLERSWGKNELVEYGSRDNFSANGGYYWFSTTRMYIRKD